MHVASAAPSLPETWQEHWFEHKELLHRVSYNDDVAVYFDPNVAPAGTEWIQLFMTRLWQYTKRTYGNFGAEGRLYCIFHQGNYSGGHPSTYLDALHDLRNVTDVGPGPFNTPQYDIPSHEVGHIVEGASDGVHGSPAFDLWKDSKWIEFYQYDAYVALGMGRMPSGCSTNSATTRTTFRGRARTGSGIGSILSGATTATPG